MENLSAFVKKFREQQKFSQSNMSRMLGMSLRTYQRFESTPENYPKHLKKFTSLFNLDLNISLDNLALESSKNNIEESNLSSMVESVSLSVPSEVKLGFCKSTNPLKSDKKDNDKTIMSFNTKFLDTFLGSYTHEEICFTTMTNDTMNPTFSSGDILFVIPFISEDKQIKDNCVYVIKTVKGSMIRRISIKPTIDTLTLHCDNKLYDSIDIKETEENTYEIIGRVIAQLKTL